MSDAEYAVLPVIVRTADDPCLLSDGEVALRIREGFIEGAGWWRERTGATFQVADPIVYRLHQTFAQLKAAATPAGNEEGFIIERYVINQLIDLGVINLCDTTRVHYYVGFGGKGDMGGNTVGGETWGCDVWPRVGGTGWKLPYWLLNIDPATLGISVPSYDNSKDFAWGSVLHELALQIGREASESVNSDDPYEQGIRDNITGTFLAASYRGYPNASLFDEDQTRAFRRSPFISTIDVSGDRGRTLRPTSTWNVETGPTCTADPATLDVGTTGSKKIILKFAGPLNAPILGTNAAGGYRISACGLSFKQTDALTTNLDLSVHGYNNVGSDDPEVDSCAVKLTRSAMPSGRNPYKIIRIPAAANPLKYRVDLGKEIGEDLLAAVRARVPFSVAIATLPGTGSDTMSIDPTTVSLALAYTQIQIPTGGARRQRIALSDPGSGRVTVQIT